MNRLTAIFACALVFLSGGCALTGGSNSSTGRDVGITAISTGVGAGTGAAIGASIANGDIAASALLGGAVGLGAGVATVAAIAYAEGAEERDNDARIAANKQTMDDLQKAIDESRERLKQDARQTQPDEEQGSHIFNGATLGNPYR